MNLLEVTGLNAGYGEVQILRDVSISIDEGELVSLVGSNGAGKTTLLNSIAGILEPWSGVILFNGDRIDGRAPYEVAERGISLVPEGRRVFPEMTVVDNLLVGSHMKHASTNRNQNLEMVYDLFPILKQRNSQKAGTLSGGEQQMLAVARSLMSSPRMIAIDEASQGLAPKFVSAILALIKRLNEGGLAVLLVDQNVRLALKIATRGYLLENGRIVASGQLYDNEKVMKSYLGL